MTITESPTHTQTKTVNDGKTVMSENNNNNNKNNLLMMRYKLHICLYFLPGMKALAIWKEDQEMQILAVCGCHKKTHRRIMSKNLVGY